MRLSKFGVLGTLALTAVCALLAVSASAAGGEGTKVYLVQLTEKPAIAYGGGTNGYEATRPAKGEKLDRDAGNVRKYVEYLKGKQDKALQSVGGGEKATSYTYAVNGFAAKLTATQAEALQGKKGVASVEEDVALSLDTATTPTFLGLTARKGLWNQLGGPKKAGRGIIVGIVDSGIWPENPSVQPIRSGGDEHGDGEDDDDRNGKRYNGVPRDWRGKCEAGENFAATTCNSKLIGAQYFDDIQNLAGRTAVIDAAGFISPRDSNGHGTHTATTAAGNYGVKVTGDAAGFGKVSGMAPNAMLAVYKVCFDDGNDGTGDCFTGDSATAIDTAVADGVDVINFSISGDRLSVTSLVETAFRNAAAAGVFVATSAGNENLPTSGPTVAHVSPWETTVAASTHDRASIGLAKLGNGTTIQGAAQITASTGVKPLIKSSDAAAVGAPVAEANLCYLGSLDPAKVAGKIVACQRGVNARTDKSLEVKNKGGAGVLLYNAAAASLNADLHFVPTVHINDLDGSVAAYAATPGATAELTTGGTPPAAPQIADFSSRGPIQGIADQLKPDISAPGVDILAGYSPATPAHRDFDIISGTSMSSPHIAGIGALLLDAHPDWTPMMVKSALMTSAGDLVGAFADTAAASPTANKAFAQGAGHVNPNGAVDPGLVYDSGAADWTNYVCAIRQATGCTTVIDPSDLNLASISIGDLAGTQTVTRTVTNVSKKSATYKAVVVAPAGIDVTVSPSQFRIGRGDTQTFTVTFTRTAAAPLTKFQAGTLTWVEQSTGRGDDDDENNGHSVRSPLVIRPVAIAAPTEVSGTAAGLGFAVKTGFVGTLGIQYRGLVAANETPSTIASDPDCDFHTAAPDTSVGFTKHIVSVPAGTRIIRLSTFNANTANAPDLDMFVYVGASNALTGASSGPSSDETVTLTSNGTPAGLTLRVYVHGCSVAATGGTYTLFDWMVPGTDAGNINGPASVAAPASTPVNLTFTGLVPGKKYMGQARYFDGTTLLGSTILRVDA
jgi:hypothetical protein